MERGAAGHAKSETLVEGFVPGPFRSEMLPADVTHEKPKNSRNTRGNDIFSLPAPAEPRAPDPADITASPHWMQGILRAPDRKSVV